MDEFIYEINFIMMVLFFYLELINDIIYNKVNNVLCVCVCKFVN